MKTIGYYNGTITTLEELMIPANDRSNYYGDGVYDAAYGRNYNTPYNTQGGSDCDMCTVCQALWCADCCCECMGGDLIRCC